MDTTLREIYDGFAETYEENRGLFDMTEVFDSFYARLEVKKEYVPEMRTIHADIRKVEFEPSRFEAITAIYSLFHVPSNDHAALFDKFYQWLCPKGKALFTYATKEYTGSIEFDGYKEFMDRKLYYSHKSPDKLYADLERIGFNIESTDYRNIGNEIFLWVMVSKPMIEVAQVTNVGCTRI